MGVEINGELVYVPKGFATDLATIPRWYWPIISPARSDLIEASIFHDYLYTCPGTFSRIEIDSIFYQILIENGTPEYVARKMFFAVRLFGSSHFNYNVECYSDDDEGDMEWISPSLKM